MDAQPQAEPPKCLICLDDEIELTDIPEAKVCVPCLERAFKLAINDPTSYPVVLGNAVLNMDSFEHLLPADVVTAFRASERMHRTPRLYRVFCAARPNGQICGRFLIDVRQARPEGTKPTMVLCRPCQAWTCIDCGQECVVGSAHRCNTEREQELPAHEKGKTWQRCPYQGCQAVATRIDGCNSMICGHCRTCFCWLCGERALHSDSHWWAKCPRFSTHDNADASWDRIPDDMTDRREILLIFLRRQYTLYKTNKAELEERLEISIAAKLDEIHKAERENFELESKCRIANEYEDLLKQKDMRLVNLRAGEHGIRYLLGGIMDEYFVFGEKREQLRMVNEITGLDIREDEFEWHDMD
ncbi:uncharacterized protein RHO25_010426 [Cercospora beticola]|uniref:RING-type domain-containing protein n=1 Tax=Cercospora beticola TaxID=122368 RepID=A0ABZ0P1P7_CERBT|nr:hypothetical protein RHO25_010426 [Cercospora beticola]